MGVAAAVIFALDKPIIALSIYLHRKKGMNVSADCKESQKGTLQGIEKAD